MPAISLPPLPPSSGFPYFSIVASFVHTVCCMVEGVGLLVGSLDSIGEESQNPKIKFVNPNGFLEFLLLILRIPSVLQ